MVPYGKSVVRTLCSLLICFSLSGCLSYGLMMVTDRSVSSYESTWASDTVSALSLGKDSNGSTGWVFIGERFDYLLTEGGESVVSLLKDPLIRRDKMSVQGKPRFMIDASKTNFSGIVFLAYAWVDEQDKKAAQGHGFTCKDSTASCTLMVSDLNGSIHQKNKEQTVVQKLAFYHPFTVEFYTYEYSDSGVKLGRVLLPVTLALDVVTLQLQFLIFNSQ